MSLRTSLTYLAARIITGVLSVLAVSLFARALGPDGYAWLALITATSAIAGGVLLQPIHQSLARFMPRQGFSDLPTTLAITLVIAVFVLFAIAAAAEQASPALLPAGVVLGAWALASAQGLFDFSAQHINSSFRPTRYAVLFITKALCLLGAGLLALRMGWGRGGVLAAMLCGFLGATVLVGASTWATVWRGHWRPALLPVIWPYAWPLALSVSLNAALQGLDRFVLSARVSAAETGAFGAAADLTQQGIVLISSAFFLAWYPRLVSATESGARQERDALASRYATLSLGLMLPVCLGFALCRENFVLLLLGEAYLATGTAVVPWLAAAAFLGGMRSYVLEVPLHLGGRMRRLLVNVGMCAGLVLVLNLLLVPVLGVVGAGLSAVLAQAAGCMLAWRFGRGVLRWRIGLRDLLSVLLACAALTLGMLAWPHRGAQWFFAQIASGALAYAVVLLALDAGRCRSALRDWWRRRT